MTQDEKDTLRRAKRMIKERRVKPCPGLIINGSLEDVQNLEGKLEHLYKPLPTNDDMDLPSKETRGKV